MEKERNRQKSAAITSRERVQHVGHGDPSSKGRRHKDRFECEGEGRGEVANPSRLVGSKQERITRENQERTKVLQERLYQRRACFMPTRDLAKIPTKKQKHVRPKSGHSEKSAEYIKKQFGGETHRSTSSRSSHTTSPRSRSGRSQHLLQEQSHNDEESEEQDSILLALYTSEEEQGEPAKKHMYQVFEEMSEEQKLATLLTWDRQPFGHIRRRPFVPFLNDTNVHKKSLGAMEPDLMLSGPCAFRTVPLTRLEESVEVTQRLVNLVVNRIKHLETAHIMSTRYANPRDTVSLDKVLDDTLGAELKGVESIAPSMWASLMKELSHVGTAQVAVATFNWLTVHFGLPHTVAAYNELIMACRQHQDFETALRVFEMLENSGLKPDILTCNLVIDVCKEDAFLRHREEACDRAYMLFERMQRSGPPPNSYTFTSLVTACRCSPSSRWRQASTTIDQMRQSLDTEQDFVVEEEFVKLCISAMCGVELEEALKIYQTLKLHSLHDRLPVYTGLLQACVRHGYSPPETAKGIHEDDVISRPQSADSSTSGSGMEIGLQVFDWIAEGGTVVPDTTAFNLLLEACASANNAEMGLRVFGWMLLGKGFADDIHVPNTITFNIIIKLCQQAGLLPFGPDGGQLEPLPVHNLSSLVPGELDTNAKAKAGPSTTKGRRQRCNSEGDDTELSYSVSSSSEEEEEEPESGPTSEHIRERQQQQLRYLGLGTPDTLHRKPPPLQAADSNCHSFNHLKQRVRLPPKMGLGTGFDNLGPGYWGETYVVSKDAIACAMDLAARWSKIPDFYLQPSLQLANESWGGAVEHDTLQESSEHWAFKVLLLLLSTVLPPPIERMDESIWGNYSKHRFGTSKLLDMRTQQDSRSRLIAAINRASTPSQHIDAQGKAIRSPTQLGFYKLMDAYKKRESKIKEVIEAEQREAENVRAKALALFKKIGGMNRSLAVLKMPGLARGQGGNGPAPDQPSRASLRPAPMSPVSTPRTPGTPRTQHKQTDGRAEAEPRSSAVPGAQGQQGTPERLRPKPKQVSSVQGKAPAKPGTGTGTVPAVVGKKGAVSTDDAMLSK